MIGHISDQRQLLYLREQFLDEEDDRQRLPAVLPIHGGVRDRLEEQ